MWKCKKCGKEFEKGKSYAVHRTHCLSGRKPWNKGLTTGPHTEEHNKKIGLKSIGRLHSEETKKLIGSYHKDKIVSKETRQKISLNSKHSNHRKGIKLTVEERKTISQRTREAMSKIHNKVSHTAKKRWENPEYRDAQVRRWAKGIEMKPNKLELRFGDFLNSHFPGEWKYVGDGQIWISGKNPDFMNINGKKKLIELFGNYFHKPEDEEIRKSHFKQFGFETIVVWEKEFISQPEKVLERVSA